jgi:molecular chaperone DnaJ
MQFRDACETLGIPLDADMSEIKKAYRILAQQWHPDRNPGRVNETRFIEIQKAYEWLEVVYSEQQKLQSQAARLKPEQRIRVPLELPEKGGDVAVTVELSLFDAFRGSQRSISFPDRQPCERCGATGNEPDSVMIPCSFCPEEGECLYCASRGQISDEPCQTCGGSGSSEQNWTVRVSIPQSVRNQTELRSINKGQWGLKGRGDLHVRVKVVDHPQLRRVGDDLWAEVPISISQAIFGGSIWVPGLDGFEYQIEVPPHISSGTRLKLSSHGFHASKQTRGDLYAIVMIVVPTSLSARQRYFYEQLLELEASEMQY